MGTCKFAFLLLLGATQLFSQKQDVKQPSNQRDRTSPPKTEAQTSASARSTNRGTLGTAERRFLLAAIRDGRMEVELGRIATERASDSRVKDFAQKMIKDHSEAVSQLQALALRKGATIPDDRTKDRQLANIDGERFDRAYALRMVADHEKGVKAFEIAAKGSTDPEVRELAQKLLPTIQMHLEEAKMLSASGNNTRDRSAKPQGTGKKQR